MNARYSLGACHSARRRADARARRVYHLDGRIMSGGKCVHVPPPHSRPSPPDETVVAGGAQTTAIRQIVPLCAGSQHLADAVEDTSIVRTTHASRLVRQHRPDGRPFIIREFVAHYTRLPFGSLYNVQRGTIDRQGPSVQRPPSRHSGHGRTRCWPAPVAIDPTATSARHSTQQLPCGI